ncbi:MAG: methyltransferase domain-containing protein [Porphyrobacter sp.]|jgi:2-polyprenyl-3-methyl-5-hydroxy-6-metoxy-1,4-benzoquinol methylase|nr:methyltransferase domain-containing protein [Porphyrobacter sp.]
MADDKQNLTDYGNVAGNHYDKYGSQNPIARALMNGFFAAFDDLSGKTRATSAFEVGCGEGELSLRLMGRGIAVQGCDLESDSVAEANTRAAAAGHGTPFAVRSIYDLADGEIAADLLVCCEVLEHLPDPHQGLERLAAQHASHILLSVPREPIWRVLNCARGKYLADFGNTPGHLQHWSRRGFVELVSGYFTIREVRSPLPWTMLLALPR